MGSETWDYQQDVVAKMFLNTEYGKRKNDKKKRVKIPKNGNIIHGVFFGFGIIYLGKI